MKYRYPRKKGPDARKSEFVSVGEAMKDAFKSLKMGRAFQEAMLINSWEQLMGKTIASRTSKIFIRNRKLFVEIESAPLKRELSLSKQRILTLVWEFTEESIIDDVIFL